VEQTYRKQRILSNCGSLGSQCRCLLVKRRLFRAYKSYRDEQGPEVNEPAEPAEKVAKPTFNIEAELNKLKTEINIANPSLEDLKRILTTLANYVK
jgi:hypothetical protein